MNFFKKLFKMRTDKKEVNLKFGNTPKNLGIKTDMHLQVLVEQLENALDSEYMEQVRNRVMKNNPDWDSNGYEWRLLELKRFFFLNVILKEVPMFSNEVDEIWHEMLLFTSDYQKFCEKFTGRLIHHSPHTSKTPDPNGRAWFDWVYSQLFEITPNSIVLYNGFFKHPLSKDTLSNHKIILDKFRADDSVEKVVTKIMETLEDQVKKAKDKYDRKDKSSTSYSRSKKEDKDNLYNEDDGFPLIFYSMYYSNDYATRYKSNIDSSSSGSCSSSFCNSSSNNDNSSSSGTSSSHSSGHSSSGSSSSHSSGHSSSSSHSSCSSSHSSCSSSSSSSCGSSCGGGD